MYNIIRRTFGIIHVEEKNGLIVVGGVPGTFMANDMARIWKTSKVGSYMFKSIEKNGFSIYSFFALDLRYMLEKMLESGKSLNMSRRTARRLVDTLNEKTWLATTLNEKPGVLDFDQLSKFHKTPFDFQMDFLEYYSKLVPQYMLKGLILAGAAGSGKTMLSLMLAECLHSGKVIVVSPKNAIYKVWKQTLDNEFKTTPTYWVADEGKPYVGQKYMVVHYEMLEKFMPIAQNLGGKITIILDESHNLNEISSLRTQLFIKLCEVTHSENVIWASGTSIKALGSESIPIFKTIDPRFNDDVQETFKKLFGKTATKGIDILANRIDLMSFKIEKKQLKLQEPVITNISVKTPDGDSFTLDSVKKDMTAFIEERYGYYNARRKKDQQFFDECLVAYSKTIKSKPEQRDFEEYQRLVKFVQVGDPRNCPDEIRATNKFEKNNIMPALDDERRRQFKDTKSIIKYVGLKIQGECLGRVLGKKRMECVLSMSNHIEYAKLIESTEKKTLIFTSYIEVLENAQRVVADLGFQPMVVYGKTNNELTKIINLFEGDKSINPLIATFNSLSTAVPLTVADVMIMLNSPFRDYVHQQAISRIHRLGADTQVYVYIAFLDTGTKPNLSTRTIDILRWSQSQVEAIMGIKSPFEIEELGVTFEHLEGREPNEHDFGISMEELGICEVFDSAEYQLMKAQSSRAIKSITLAKW